MTSIVITKTVEEFARQTLAISDSNLERDWAWQSYDSEGIRFAFFRTYEELRELAVTLRGGRAPLTQAQLILASYEGAYRDLQAALLGIERGREEQAPAEGEWPVRKVLAHIFGAELGFYAVIKYAIERQRSDDGRPEQMPREVFAEVSGVDEETFGRVMSGAWQGLQEFYGELHQRVLREFAAITDAELETPSFYWENEPYSLRFRLHRLDSHLRQHTIQIDKTNVAIGQPPSEVKRLLRLIYSGLADLNGATLGTPETGEKLQQEAVERIRARAEEIAKIGC